MCIVIRRPSLSTNRQLRTQIVRLALFLQPRTSMVYPPVSYSKRKRHACLALICCFILVGGVSVTVLLATGFHFDESGEGGIPIALTPTRSPVEEPVMQDPTSAPVEVDVKDPNACNGLVNLCSKRANEILYATMHNANSDADTATFRPNHNRGILDALEAGVRGINVDFGYCDGKLSMVHGLCVAGASDPVEKLSQVQQFLADNPREVVIIPSEINDDVGGVVRIADVVTVLEQVKDSTGRSMFESLYSHQPGDPWPTLGELIEINKRILFFHYNGEEACFVMDCPPGFHDWFTFAAETNFSFQEVSDIEDDPSGACAITRGENGLRNFFGVNIFLEQPDPEASTILNSRSFMENHLTTCGAQNNQPPNLALVDFWSLGDVVPVVNDFNANL